MNNFDVKKFYSLGKKIVGAGLNFRSVVKERGLAEPSVPVVFLKPTSSYILEGQPIQALDTNVLSITKHICSIALEYYVSSTTRSSIHLEGCGFRLFLV